MPPHTVIHQAHTASSWYKSRKINLNSQITKIDWVENGMLSHPLWHSWSVEGTWATKIRQILAIWPHTPMSLTQFLLATVQLKLNFAKGSGIWSCICSMCLTELHHLLHWGAGGEQMYHKWRSVYINTFVKIL